jgi:F420-dependent oxidoreductase-like protein
MRFSLWPMGAQSWDELLGIFRLAEETGWDGVWYADHFMPNQQNTSPPVAEVWPTVAAAAALVPRLRIGTLVCGNTYRHPAVVAKMAAQVDIISGGRFVLGMGAGWQENEHHAYGIPFYTVGERVSRLQESCRIIRELLRNDRTEFHGRYYHVEDAPLSPKPVQQPLPLLVGGGGEQRTMRIAARYADEWNTWGTPETIRHKVSVLDQHCVKDGRNPAEIKRSAQAVFMLDNTEERIEAARNARRFPVIAGNADELQQTVAEYRDAGLDELVVPTMGLGRGDELESTVGRFINEVATPFR